MLHSRHTRMQRHFIAWLVLRGEKTNKLVSWCWVTPKITLPQLYAANLAVQWQKRHSPAPSFRKGQCYEDDCLSLKYLPHLPGSHSSPNTPYQKKSFYLGNYATLGALCLSSLPLSLSDFFLGLCAEGVAGALRKWRLHLAKVKGKGACYTLTGTSLPCPMMEHSRHLINTNARNFSNTSKEVLTEKPEWNVHVGFKCLCINCERWP